MTDKKRNFELKKKIKQINKHLLSTANLLPEKTSNKTSCCMKKVTIEKKDEAEC